MQTGERMAKAGASLQQEVLLAVRQRLTWREAALLLSYHMRLLNWWLLLLMALGFLGAAGLAWVQLHLGGVQGLIQASAWSRFVMEPGAGLLAGMLASSLLVADPALELMLPTRAGVLGVAIWRFLLTFLCLALCSATYLAWSLANGIIYGMPQSPLFLLLLWLAPVLAMGMLGLLGALATRNPALGLALAAVPLAGSLFLYLPLHPIQATHPFFLSYTFSAGEEASDWWANRLTLLGIAGICAFWNWWLLRREERLLGN